MTDEQERDEAGFPIGRYGVAVLVDCGTFIGINDEDSRAFDDLRDALEYAANVDTGADAYSVEVYNAESDEQEDRSQPHRALGWYGNTEYRIGVGQRERITVGCHSTAILEVYPSGQIILQGPDKFTADNMRILQAWRVSDPLHLPEGFTLDTPPDFTV